MDSYRRWRWPIWSLRLGLGHLRTAWLCSPKPVWTIFVEGPLISCRWKNYCSSQGESRGKGGRATDKPILQGSGMRLVPRGSQGTYRLISTGHVFWGSLEHWSHQRTEKGCITPACRPKQVLPIPSLSRQHNREMRGFERQNWQVNPSRIAVGVCCKMTTVRTTWRVQPEGKESPAEGHES